MFFTIQAIIKAIALVHNIMRELALDGILVKRSPSGLMPKKYIVDGENIRASWKDYFMAEYPQNEIRWTMENSLIEMFRMEQQNYAKIFGWQWQKSWRWTHCLMVVRAGLPVAAYCRINGHGGFVYRSDMPFCVPFFLLCVSLSTHSLSLWPAFVCCGFALAFYALLCILLFTPR